MGHDRKNETVDPTAEMGFFRRVAGVSVRDRVKSSVIHENLRADAPLLRWEPNEPSIEDRSYYFL